MKQLMTIFLVVTVLAIGTSQAGPVPPVDLNDFAVLGGSTVTNTGSSVLTGDLGVWPGTAITGFFGTTQDDGPGIVIGAIHEGDSTADTAHTDLIALYTVKKNALGGVAGGELGGAILTPGVYTYGAGAATWSTAGTTLTLDALGNSSAQWIFQIGTTLITPASATVSLVNGASANNVFWQVGSSATIGGTNTFAGNILAQASIDFGGGTMYGRALAIDGAVTLGSVAENITIPEPATLCLLGLGALSMLRRKKSA
jgi:hypothetical protein